MKTFLPLALITLAIIINSCQSVPPIAPQSVAGTTEASEARRNFGFCTPYSQRTTVSSGGNVKDSAWLQLPCSYNYIFSSLKRYPLIIFLNGVGEASNRGNLNVMKKWGPPTFINDSIRYTFLANNSLFEFIVLAPQSKTGFRSASSTNAVIDYMIKNYRIDASRIYLTGLSSGALSVYNYLTEKQEYANRIAAAVPMSAINLDAAHKANLKFIANANVYIKAFCGTSDGIYKNNVGYVNTINSYKSGLATLVSYNGTHCCWNSMYDPSHTYYNPNIYEWMLNYHR